MIPVSVSCNNPDRVGSGLYIFNFAVTMPDVLSKVISFTFTESKNTITEEESIPAVSFNCKFQV
jgi:hypothetical protein